MGKYFFTRKNPILHFYEREIPSATYGYVIHPEQLFAVEEFLQIRGCELTEQDGQI